MDERMQTFVAGYFNVEMADQRVELRRVLSRATPAYQDSIRAGLEEILRTRSLSPDEFWDLTHSPVSTVDDLYAQLEAGYREIFGTDSSG